MFSGDGDELITAHRAVEDFLEYIEFVAKRFSKGNYNNAEDIRQEICLKLLEHRDILKPRGWWFKLISYRGVDATRKIDLEHSREIQMDLDRFGKLDLGDTP